MKYILFLLPVFCLSLACQQAQDYSLMDVPKAYLDLDFELEKVQELALGRLGELLQLHRDSLSSPRSWDSQSKQLISDPAHVWTVGFYVGSLWMAYEHSSDPIWKLEALKFAPFLESQVANTSTHDLGFMLFNSLGKADSATLYDSYKRSLLLAVQSLKSRFSPSLGAIESQNSQSPDDFVVIIDNLINLELLCWAAQEGRDSNLIELVKAHAQFTEKYFIRRSENRSCRTHHKILFDASDGKPQKILAGQGASPGSVWSRGQAWGIYGYTMLYRWLKDSAYLSLARCLADYWIDEVPEDGIPYWDFEAALIPNEARDASAAAITASALLELSSFLSAEEGRPYFFQAQKSLKSLSYSTYFLPPNKPFILDHSTLSHPGNVNIDAPQTMADYYFLEALGRYKKISPKFLP